LSRASVEDSDPVRVKLRGLLLTWYSTLGTTPSTSKELVDKGTPKGAQLELDGNANEIFSNPELYEVLTEYFSDRRGDIRAKAVGDFIARNQRRIECGVCFEDAGNYGTRKLWKIAIADQTTLENELRKFFNRS
jgi:hypothetical protein